jgi:hypothetical protein
MSGEQAPGEKGEDAGGRAILRTRAAPKLDYPAEACHNNVFFGRRNNSAGFESVKR